MLVVLELSKPNCTALFWVSQLVMSAVYAVQAEQGKQVAVGQRHSVQFSTEQCCAVQYSATC